MYTQTDTPMCMCIRVHVCFSVYMYIYIYIYIYVRSHTSKLTPDCVPGAPHGLHPAATSGSVGAYVIPGTMPLVIWQLMAMPWTITVRLSRWAHGAPSHQSIVPTMLAWCPSTLTW